MPGYDIAIIGAGIHGAGIAQAAAAAGYRVVVIEKNHVAAGTSSKSSKLIHGGLRYLESGQFSLVRKSLKERAILCRIAPTLVKLQPFYIPVYKQTQRRPWQIIVGLSIYALLGNLHKHNLFRQIKPDDFNHENYLDKTGLQKIYQYYDGQTNDVKLTQAVMNSAKLLGAELICPAKIMSVNKTGGIFNIAYSKDDKEKNITANLIVNAAGPWVNEVLASVKEKTTSLNIELVQGTHLIIDAPVPGGIFYLEAPDSRAVFVMPYEINGELKTMIGTTEKKFTGSADEVLPLQDEIEYLLAVYKKYFPGVKNISVIQQFSGLRVLPVTDKNMFSRPRDTILRWSSPGILSLYGGKLTAYRSTADLVMKKIRPFLVKRRRIASTDQLFLF